jgi:hypothetical protein
MEGGDQRAIFTAAQEVTHPRPHLFRGFIGERHRQDARTGDPVLLHQMRHPMRDYARLAAPGAGQQEQRTFDVGHGGLLLRIQTLKKIHLAISAWNNCGGDKAILA